MKHKVLAALLLFAAFDVCNAQSAPAGPADAAASAPAKHKLLKKLRAKHPPASAANPEASPDKKGGG